LPSAIFLLFLTLYPENQDKGNGAEGMKKSRSAAVLAISMIVYACGGGGSSSSGGVSPVVIAPTPPTAPPPPPPPPPPPVITAIGAFSMLAEFRFFPTGYNVNLTNASSASGDRQGRYPIQSGQPLFSATFGSPPSNYATVEKQAFGLDSAGVFLFGGVAPAEATVISPLTILLYAANNEDKLETQLGINGSLFGLSTNRPIMTFVPTDALTSTDAAVAADGERLLAHHLRVLAVGAALEHMAAPADPSGLKRYNIDGVKRFLDAAPARFIFNNSDMTALLRTVDFGGRFPKPVYRDDVFSAAAHLVNAYASTIGVRIASREQAAKFQIGIWGYLVPELTRLLEANDAATAAEVLAITNSQILAEISRYSEQLAFDVNDNYFPSPDFYSIAKGGSYLVPSFDEGSNGNGPLTSNDIHLNPDPVSANHFGSGSAKVTSLSVPQVNISEISVTLNADGTVLIRPAANFVGVTYFDYTATHPRGDVEQGRVYVRVR
jgi:Bacterial Ig domain